ncbi:MAG: alpha/beta hydrolase [Methylobacteriaceae bacterium]|nr:alpha/beta hydrolase [Methylobacteriaceae bacterium]
MELIGTPDNPVPPGALISAVGAEDGALLRIARWSPGPKSLGTVCVFTGRGEFIEKYFETIGELVERGFSVVAMDWRGQGLSARELPDPFKGHIDDFDMFERDLEALRKQVLQFLCPRPWYALGHSMAAAVLLSQAHAGRSPFERLVLVSPMIEIAGRAAHASTRVVVEIADAVGLGASYAPGVSRRSSMSEPFEGNELTSDPGRYVRNAAIVEAAPQLAIAGPTIGWINAALRVTRDFADPEFPRRTGTPILIVVGADDHVVSIPAMARFANRLKAGRMIQLSGARHELLQETDAIRAQFWAAFDAFVPGGREEAAALRRATDQEAAQRIFNPPWWRRLFGGRRRAA